MADNRTMKEHFDLINNSTFIQNVNTGNAIDHNRYLLSQKQDHFKKLKSDVGDFFKEQTASQSNYARLK
jgi:hypothetical protein|tara:strand:+ start:3656 stop:3862 length:207 start_codon:yes stop_codon:yes gene_type:complete